MAGRVLPTGDTLDTYLPTFLYISTVSLLDDALEAFIATNYPDTDVANLHRRIDFLNAKEHLRMRRAYLPFARSEIVTPTRPTNMRVGVISKLSLKTSTTS